MTCVETPPSKFVMSEDGRAVQKKFWKESIELFQMIAPEVKRYIIGIIDDAK